VMRFKADNIEEEELTAKRKILLFARPCDINGIRILDRIFLENGAPDLYYERQRKILKVILLECSESFDDCFCVSTENNCTDEYAMAIRLNRQNDTDDILFKVCDKEFEEYFKNEEKTDFEPISVSENKKKLQIPDINISNRKAISQLDYWKQFDERCIGCGGCTAVCGTCSCFDTSDIILAEGKPQGERLRIWSSCMFDSFTDTAGGGRLRKTRGDAMRFKVFHKFYDYKERFKEEHMCTGCGRCDMRCTKEISFFNIVNGLNDEIQSAQLSMIKK